MFVGDRTTASTSLAGTADVGYTASASHWSCDRVVVCFIAPGSIVDERTLQLASPYQTIIVQEKNKYIKDFHFFNLFRPIPNTCTDTCAITAMLCKTPGSIRILEITWHHLNYSMLVTAPLQSANSFILYCMLLFITTRVHTRHSSTKNRNQNFFA